MLTLRKGRVKQCLQGLRNRLMKRSSMPPREAKLYYSICHISSCHLCHTKLPSLVMSTTYPVSAHLTCTVREPELSYLLASNIQPHTWYTYGADMDKAMMASLGPGLLLPRFIQTQIYSNQTAVVKLSSNSSQSTSATPN